MMFGGQRNTASQSVLPGEPGRSAEPSNGSFTTFNVAEYWRLAVKHRMLLVGSLLFFLLAAAAATLLMTPTYTASATIQIDRESARVVNVDDVQPQESMIQGEEFFQTQYGLLRSRSLAERVVDSLGLASSDQFLESMNAETPRSGEGTAAVQASRRREVVLKTVRDNLGISPVRGSRLVVISFSSPDPTLSSNVANAFARNFIQSNLDRKYESSSYAREFLEELIAQTKGRLEQAERQLTAYATNQQIINIREGDNADSEPQSIVSADLSNLNQSLAAARAARIAAEQRWRQAAQAPLTQLPEVLNNPAVQNLMQTRAALNSEYQQKLQAYQPDFPEMVQLRARISELDAQITAIANGIRESIRGQFVVAASQERSLRATVEGLKAESLDLRERSIQYNILQREVDTSRTLYDGLLQRYKEVGVTGGVTANNISIVDEAAVPTKPSSPRLLVNLAIAFVLGSGFGVMAAFILEALDETIATPDDIESKLGISVLGVSPLLPKGQDPISALSDLRSAFSEAYYSLRTALQFSTPDGVPPSLLVTSSRPAEGKSTTAYAIAINLARLGLRVLLVDGDLRNPSMHRVVGTDNDAGMSNLLSGAAALDQVVKPTSQPGLEFISCGPLPPNPAELWGGKRLASILAEAGTRYDHVIVDGPPVLGFADAPLLASNIAGTIFVLEAKGTRRAQARGALRRLTVGDIHLLGAVLTKFNAKSVQYGGYDYAYDYQYGQQASDKQTGRKRK